MKDVPRSMLIYQADTARKCGDCQLCCKLVPVADNLVGLHKPANTRCPYQRHHKGCTIYDAEAFGVRVLFVPVASWRRHRRHAAPGSRALRH